MALVLVVMAAALSAAPASASEALQANPATASWTGPYGGVPPFGRVRPAEIRAGFAPALAARDAEVQAIAGNPAAPTFDNTIAPLERAGEAYNRLSRFYGTYTNSLNDTAMQAVERELAPKYAAASDDLLLNEKLFGRVSVVYASADRSTLTPEQQRLTWRTYDAFVRFGAKLTPAQKTRLKQINQELAKLYADFSQKVLADENTWVTIDDRSELVGLSQSLVDAYAAAAREKGLAGKWIVVNTRSSVDPFLTYAANRALRQKVWTAFKSRGDNGDRNDTNATIASIMPLRQERARLLGYPSYAHWKLSDKMAKNPERAMALMQTVWTPAKARIREEVAAMQAIAAKEGAGLTIEPWDYLYYAEKVRKADYDLDQNELKPYFELNRMIDAAFWMANRLYGLSFKEISGKVPVFHPDMRVWEVREGDRFVGLFYGDYFAREGKRSGAWENAYRAQSRSAGEATPLVSNNNNFVKAASGDPILISLDDAETLFHEFGHAIHDLVSNVTYESLSGVNVSTDFGEVPSHVHENWVLTPEILNRFATHYRTGAPMPQALLAKVHAAEKFNQGYAAGEILASSIVDMEMHMRPDGIIDPDRFEREVMQRIGAPREVAMRHRVPQFLHLFADESYAAGYYSYTWSDTMAADAWKAFNETGDVWDPQTARRLKAMMAAGDSRDPADLYRAFRGRDPDVNALLDQRGFPTGATASD